MIKALIFDFDGLIMDTETPEVEAWQEVYAAYGQEFPLDIWVRAVVGATTAHFDPALHLARLTGQRLDAQALHERTRAVRLARQALLPPRPGVTALIQQAKALGLRRAIASSSPHAWVEGYLRQSGLLSEFEAVLCREDVPRVKPYPDLFLAALQALALKPEEALALEDSPNGVLAAKRAGLRVVAVPNPVTERGDFTAADLKLRSLADMSLVDLLRCLDGRAERAAPGACQAQ
jgi:HAD superfamily hydrolase (TIGR01509 family)